MIFLYCLSTATLFHAALVEPQNLRLSYWKFLYDLSGGRSVSFDLILHSSRVLFSLKKFFRIATMSRLPIDEFGLESSRQLQDILQKTRTHDKHVYRF